MTNSYIIAIDGPAGSGKSSVSKEIARRRGYGYLDTGSAYRGLAWRVLENGDSTDNADAVLAALASFAPVMGLDPDVRTLVVDGTDVTAAIREPRVSDAVSGVARIPAVRERLNAMFHEIVMTSGREAVVIEGRDITTVVAPDAPVRMLLTARAEVRAARRSGELAGQSTADVAAAIARRDASDSAVVDFFDPAPGVVLVDSSDLDFEQTIAAVLAVVDGATGENHAD